MSYKNDAPAPDALTLTDADREAIAAVFNDPEAQRQGNMSGLLYAAGLAAGAARARPAPAAEDDALVARARKQSAAIYTVADKAVAEDVDDCLTQCADRIVELLRDKYRAAHTAMNVRESRASANLCAARRALRQAVPREPTKEMQMAGLQELDWRHLDQAAKKMWQAMYDVAPKGEI